jgi:hypothetical protein
VRPTKLAELLPVGLHLSGGCLKAESSRAEGRRNRIEWPGMHFAKHGGSHRMLSQLDDLTLANRYITAHDALAPLSGHR